MPYLFLILTYLDNINMYSLFLVHNVRGKSDHQPDARSAKDFCRIAYMDLPKKIHGVYMTPPDADVVYRYQLKNGSKVA